MFDPRRPCTTAECPSGQPQSPQSRASLIVNKPHADPVSQGHNAPHDQDSRAMLRAAMTRADECTSCAQTRADMNLIAHKIGHDLRAPLRAMKTLPEWIVEEFEEQGSTIPSQAIEYLDLITTKTILMESMLAGLLEYALVADPAASPSIIDVPTKISEIADMHVPEGRFDISIAPPLSKIEAVAEDFEICFTHLISNAVKHNDKATPKVHIEAHMQDETAIFLIADNGPGIDPQFHQRIFEPFAQLKSRKKGDGSGLGLAIARKVAESWGGALNLQSDMGHGTCFKFSFPVAVSD
jgi:signal transduction histidine kinase